MKIGPGRNPKRITISDAREVSPEELAQAQKASDPVVKRFRETHHMMARCFAMGMPIAQIANAMGMSYNRVAMFSGDPAFQNLVAEYRLVVNQDWLETAQGRLALYDYAHGMGMRQMVDQMEEVDDGGPPIPIPTLLKVTADCADRLGYAKRTVSITVDGTFAAKLDRAIERSGLRQHPMKIVDGARVPTGQALPHAHQDREHPETDAPTGQEADLTKSRAQPPEVEGPLAGKGHASARGYDGVIYADALEERRA